MTTTVHSDVLILGGGIAGLSCRAALAGNRDVTLLEKEGSLGGLLKMNPCGEFIFDTTLHVLPLRDKNVANSIRALVPDGFYSFAKRNLIWQQGHVIDYPYQFHARQLPSHVRAKCLEHFPRSSPSLLTKASFRHWLLEEFGKGFYEHFFEPYNTKLYGICPSRLEATPMTWTIPAGDREAVIHGSNKHKVDTLQQSIVCYPRGKAGISALALGMEQLGTGRVLTSCAVELIDTRRRIVRCNDGSSIHYGSLVSTLPLPELISRIKDIPHETASAASELRVQSITVIQVGTTHRSRSLDAHWTYFPDPEIPFYRLTRLENISPDLAPPEASALLLEIPGKHIPDRETITGQLLRVGAIKSRQLEHYHAISVPYAYVLFLSGYQRAVKKIQNYLVNNEIQSIGRFGEWRYCDIEQTISSGFEAARKLKHS